MKNEELPKDYHPPKDLVNAIWGTCFDYCNLNKKIKKRIIYACFVIEKIYSDRN
jgi:hypothetical protein